MTYSFSWIEMEQVEYLRRVKTWDRNLHDVATSLAVGINTINGSKDQFLLQVTESHDILLGLLGFDLGVSCDNTEACAGGIQKTSIEFSEHAGQLAAILARHNAVSDTESVHVCVQ
jgi:hypothetical protein